MTEPDEHTLLQTETGQGESREASASHIPKIEGYEFLAEAGSGSFGDVWQAVQSKTGQEVAVKLLKVDSLGVRDQFRLELERLRKVSTHPFIVGLVDADLEHEPPYLVMPWLPTNLSNQPSKGQTLEESLRLIEQIAEALKFTHDKGLLHCDLKPGNILLDESGQSLVLGQDRGTWGTLGWMPPEQATHGEQTTPTTIWDIYALGAVAYWLLTGQQPRMTDELLESLRSEVSTSERLAKYGDSLKATALKPTREGNPKVDQDLAEIVESCLRLDPAARPQTVSDVLEDLRRRRSGDPLLCRRPWSVSYRVKRFLSRPLALATLIFVLLGLVGVGYSYSALESRNTELVRKQYELLFEHGVLEQDRDFSHALFSWVDALHLSPEDRVVRSNIQRPTLVLTHQVPSDDEIQPLFGTFHFNDNIVWLVEADIAQRKTLLRTWNLETGEVERRQTPREVVGESEALGGLILARTAGGVSVLRVADLEAVGDGPVPGKNVTLSGDGKSSASHTDTRLELYELESGESLLEREVEATNLKLSYDGRTLAFESARGVEIQNLDGEKWSLGEPGTRVLALYEATVLTESGRKKTLWDYRTQSRIAEFPRNSSGWSSQGLWKHQGGQLVWHSQEPNRRAQRISVSRPRFWTVSNDGRYLATCSELELSVWSTRSGRRLGSAPVLQDGKSVGGIAFDQDGSRLATWNSTTLLIFDFDPGVDETRTQVSGKRVAFDSEHRVLISGSTESQVWDPRKGELSESDEVPRRWARRSAHYDRVREAFGVELMVHADNTLGEPKLVVSTVGGEEVATVRAGYVQALALNSDDTLLAVASESELTVYEPRSGQKLKVLRDENRVQKLHWVGESLIVGHVGGGDKKPFTEVYDSVTWSGRKIPGQFLIGASAEESALLVTGGQRASLYDLRTLKPRWTNEGLSPLAIFDGPQQAVYLAGRRVIRCLDAETGRQLHPPFAWDEDIAAMALSEDGKHLAALGRQGLLRRYHLPSAQSGSPAQIQARVEAWTGFHRGPGGRIRRLPVADWARRSAP